MRHRCVSRENHREMHLERRSKPNIWLAFSHGSKDGIGSPLTVQVRAQANQAVQGQANHEIQQHARVHGKPLVLQRFRKVRPKRFVVNCVAKEDRDQIFEPSPGSRAENFLLLRQGPMVPAGAVPGAPIRAAEATGTKERPTPACPEGRAIFILCQRCASVNGGSRLALFAAGPGAAKVGPPAAHCDNPVPCERAWEPKAAGVD